LATEEHGLPIGAVVTGANANEGRQVPDVLGSLVIRPPAPAHPSPSPDRRDLPRVRADGGYGSGPARQRGQDAGFRIVAPSRGQAQRPGFGRVRCAVERGHAWLSQFGRIARRLDRQAKRYLGWVQLAAAIIYIRHEANGFVR
jgi:putative transposase